VSLSEFEAIATYFESPSLAPVAKDIILGIGDDGAVLELPANQQLVVAADTLVEGIHFPADFPPEWVAYRALGANLSDIAAMGASPRWYTLCISLPRLDCGWLEAFCSGLAAASAPSGLSLVGGDTSRGPLTVSVQILGLVPRGGALRRAGAQPGDAIYVTGHLGDAAAGLAVWQAGEDAGGRFENLLRRFTQPRARLREGVLLRGMASSCIDISDGLLADLGHICSRSAVAAHVYLDRLPISRALLAWDPDRALENATAGGDDYELCFTLPAAKQPQLQRAFRAEGLQLTRIGEMVGGSGVHCFDAEGAPRAYTRSGYEHFR
jgi:thiamine-monophosphate kinase